MWKVKCCRTLKPLSGNSRYSSWINDWDGIMDYTLPYGYHLVGLHSVHTNQREDRRWDCMEISKI